MHRKQFKQKASEIQNKRKKNEQEFAKPDVKKLFTLLLLIAGMQMTLAAQSEKVEDSADTENTAASNVRKNRIVGIWDVQATVRNCTTGAQIASFQALHKYESGGTGQVVPATNPALLSAHMSIWNQGRHRGDYYMTFKMFRFDSAGNNTGYVVVKNNISIDDDEYSGFGEARVFDINGNQIGMSCPSFSGTRFR